MSVTRTSFSSFNKAQAVSSFSYPRMEGYRLSLYTDDFTAEMANQVNVMNQIDRHRSCTRRLAPWSIIEIIVWLIQPAVDMHCSESSKFTCADQLTGFLYNWIVSPVVACKQRYAGLPGCLHQHHCLICCTRQGLLYQQRASHRYTLQAVLGVHLIRCRQYDSIWFFQRDQIRKRPVP